MNYVNGEFHPGGKGAHPKVTHFPAIQENGSKQNTTPQCCHHWEGNYWVWTNGKIYRHQFAVETTHALSLRHALSLPRIKFILLPIAWIINDIIPDRIKFVLISNDVIMKPGSPSKLNPFS